jgi:hypothetical protein
VTAKVRSRLSQRSNIFYPRLLWSSAAVCMIIRTSLEDACFKPSYPATRTTSGKSAAASYPASGEGHLADAQQLAEADSAGRRKGRVGWPAVWMV